MADVNIVRCTNCGQHWNEVSVPHIKYGAGTVGETSGEGCDNCGTDAYLMDIPAVESKSLGYIQ